jgi:HAD superfamily hydrolase (TIGR01509 family)
VVDLEAIGSSWWSALDAAESALRAAAPSLTATELQQRGGRLTGERAATARLLDEVAEAERLHAGFSQLLVSRSSLRQLLALPSAVRACVFNLDGVLVGSAELHAAAWAETFDDLILARLEREHGRFSPPPFDPHSDYEEHIHGKPRLDGVRAFLASRGISLPEGAPEDVPGAETVNGLANRKRAALLRRLDAGGVSAFAGSRRYLETARDAGIRRVVVSASANTAAILERSGLASLVDERVDGEAITAAGLRPRPAPDILLAACRAVDVLAGEAAAFETSAEGIEAARAAGFRLVVAVASDGHDAALRSREPDLVVAGLAELLEHDLHRARART